MTLHYRTVFLSDTHLGSRASQAALLSRFLKHVRCEQLYLVGDIVDIWRMSQKWYWPGEHNNVIRRILNHTKHGTDVVFIPGNHDEGARQFLGLEFGGVRVEAFDVHATADGRRLFVTHGDHFDLVVRHHRLLSKLGGKAYEMLVNLNRPYNAGRRMLGLPRHSMSKAIKLKVKKACNFISEFEIALERETRQRGLDGVVCGHIHKPEIREAEGADDIAYYNCGDWIEDCTAIVEDHDGTIRLIYAEQELERLLDATGPAPSTPAEDSEELLPLEELISVARIFGDPAEEATPRVNAALETVDTAR
ncbi:MAG: UDP-2,3-diacylglucosamine diphosphatase [Planctomycetota bacterium]